MDLQPQRAPEIDARPNNNLLRKLNSADYGLLTRQLEACRLPAGDVLYNPGDDVAVVYFPCGASLTSYLIASEDGRDVETVLIGREGAIGGIVSQGYLPAYSRISVKFGGDFLRLRVAALEAAKLKSPTLRNLFARYADCVVAQLFQATACNAIHTIEQRTAKWILAAMDRTGSSLVPLTHEQLATMLGVGRSYTSRVVQSFKAEAVLETRRGALLVLDKDELQARSCLCNESVRNHFEEVLSGVYPPDVAEPV